MSTCATKRHDTMSAYRQGCRCPAAREAWRLYRKRGRHGTREPLVVNSLGTARRLQALAALGWTLADLGTELGYNKSMVGHLQTRRHKQILKSTADRVTAAFNRLSMQVGGSDKTRRRAVREGWPPPLAWNDDIDDPRARPAGSAARGVVDEVLVSEALAGRRGERQLNRAEAHAGIEAGLRMQLSAVEIAARLGISDRTVHRFGSGATDVSKAA
jgi:hypothetical protein